MTDMKADTEKTVPEPAPAEELSEPMTIPVEAYISEEYARAEADKLWAKVWQQVGRVEEIPEVGDFLTYDILDDSIIVVRTGPDAVEVVEVAEADPGPLRLDGSGGRIGPGHAGDLVTCREQFVDHGGTDPTGGSGDEDAHDVVSFLRDVDVSHRRQ